MQGFKDLAEQRKRLQQREQQLELREQQLAAQHQPPQQTPKASADLPAEGDQPSEKVLDLIKQKNQAFLDGDDDKAAKLEYQILQMQGPSQKQAVPQPDPVELVDQVADKLDERNRKALIRKDRAEFLSNHSDLKQDAKLFAMVDAETEVVARENPDYRPLQVMEEAYKRIQQWRGKPEPDTKLKDKAEEKRQMIRPRAATGRADAPPQPVRQTKSDYVQQLKEQRGQV